MKTPSPVIAAVLAASQAMALQLQTELDAMSQAGLSTTVSIVLPEDNCCRFYDYTGFSGTSKELCHLGTDQPTKGRQEMLSNWGLRREVESIRCGKNARLEICRDTSEACTGENSMSVSGNIPIVDSDWDFEQVTVWPYDRVKQGYVTLFNDDNCEGTFASFPSLTKGTAYYNEEQMYARGISWNDAESIAIPKGYRVDLYADDSWVGPYETLISDAWRESDGSEEMKCVELPDSVNDTVESFRVVRAASLPLQGRWLQTHGANRKLEIEATTGWSSNVEQEKKS